MTLALSSSPTAVTSRLKDAPIPLTLRFLGDDEETVAFDADHLPLRGVCQQPGGNGGAASAYARAIHRRKIGWIYGWTIKSDGRRIRTAIDTRAIAWIDDRCEPAPEPEGAS